ncbi:MAG: DUF4252 domain-containing protein [Pseudomonadota bacterium]
MRRLATLLLTALLLTPLAAVAQGLTDHPGFVDFGDLDGIADVEPTVEVSLGPALLGFLRKTVANEDPELSSTLGKLRGIELRVFELRADQLDNARDQALSISKRLKSADWEPALRVRGGDGTVHMFMKTRDEIVEGMVVMIVESGGDAVFLNIVGEIDPEQLGSVASRFGVDLDDL